MGPPERRLILVFTALLTLTPAVALAQPWNTPVKSFEEQQREALEKACRAFARLCAPPAAPPPAAAATPPAPVAPMPVAPVLRDMKKRGNLDRLPFRARTPAASACAWPRRRGVCSCRRQS